MSSREIGLSVPECFNGLVMGNRVLLRAQLLLAAVRFFLMIEYSVA
jgi:hypothetical protein